MRVSRWEPFLPVVSLECSWEQEWLATLNVALVLKTRACRAGQPEIEPTLSGARPKEGGLFQFRGRTPNWGLACPVSQRGFRANVTGASGAALEPEPSAGRRPPGVPRAWTESPRRVQVLPAQFRGAGRRPTGRECRSPRRVRRGPAGRQETQRPGSGGRTAP